MEPRPRSRRLTTYGSKAKNQTQLKSKSSQSSKASQIPDRSYRSTGGEKAENQLQRPSNTEDADIYNLPSSDEENRRSTTRIKRRRFGSNGRSTLMKEPFNSPGKTDNDIESNPSITFAKADPTVSQGPGVTSPATRNITQATYRSSRYKGSARSPSKTLGAAAPTEDAEMTRKPDTRRSISQTTQPAAWSPKPAKSPKSPAKITTAMESGTPGRRRLVDSLGTRGQSTDGASADTLSDGYLSPAVAPATPTRREESVRLKALAGDQREGESQDHDTTVAISPHLRGSKVTYARQRSFLDDLLLDAEPSHSSISLGENDPLAQMTKRDANSDARGRRISIDEPVNDDGTVRSIHELRQAGGNARYRGAVDSIFEDLEDSHISTSGRCNAFVQLCVKLLDPKLAGQFLECNFDKRLVALFSREFDLASYSLGLCAYDLCFLGRPIPYIIATNAWPKLLGIATSLLDAQDDILKMTRSPRQRISKATHLSIENVVPQLRSALFPNDPMTKLSPCFLILKSLKKTLLAFQEKGENPSNLPVPLLKQLVNLMLCITSSLEQNALSAIEPDKSQILALGLSILEAHTASSHPLEGEQRDILNSLPDLSGLLSERRGGSEGSVNTTTRQIEALYIRVILNVTNSYPVLCDAFATSRIIDELAEITITHFSSLSEDSLSQDDNGASLDTVILALGALINVTEQSEISRAIFLESGTKGSSRKSLLSRLLELFMSHVDSISEAHSVPEVHHNVAVGYLAVLLLALCLNTSARFEVKQSLQSKGLTMIISIADEFLQYHRKIENELQPRPVHGEATGFPGRLQDLINHIQHSES